MTGKNIEQLSGKELKALIDRGIIRVMNNQPLPQTIEDTPEYRKHLGLKGVEISINEAARKYGLHARTISRWVQKGVIVILRRNGQAKLLDESYVAYAVEVKNLRPSPGNWIFDKNGLPYIPTTR
jgi:hypothetical protein